MQKMLQFCWQLTCSWPQLNFSSFFVTSFCGHFAATRPFYNPHIHNFRFLPFMHGQSSGRGWLVWAKLDRHRTRLGFVSWSSIYRPSPTGWTDIAVVRGTEEWTLLQHFLRNYRSYNRRTASIANTSRRIEFILRRGKQSQQQYTSAAYRFVAKMSFFIRWNRLELRRTFM